jgi:hypothetical protein
MRLRLIILYSIFNIQYSIAQTYFQQDVSYTIHVSLDDRKHELSGDETVVYTNNSKDTLTDLYFHIWPNAYKDLNTQLARQFFKHGDNRMITAAEKDFGYINNLDFMIDGKQINWEELPDTNDICVLHLPDSLLPGTSITISTPFHVKIPSGKFSRLGHIGEAYMISQWYPKPAVYDRKGWNYFPYLDQGEFYSEFGTFDVYITLPQNYVLNATGDLVDGEKELKWLDEKVKETEAINPFSTDMSFPKSSDTLKTLHYHQEKVHDFAWFADKRWHVLKGTIELPTKPQTSNPKPRTVTSWTMFTNADAELWKKSIEYINDAVKYYSEWVGEYPYNNVSAVDGTISAGGGMEYPNITVIGSAGDAFELETTIAHEVGHNWFYGMLGSNERRHPWMDEGINTSCELRYIYTKYANDSAKQIMDITNLKKLEQRFGLTDLTERYIMYFEYLYSARTNRDQAPDLSSEKFSMLNYQADVYAKTAVCFDYLKSYLGDSLYTKCMHAYFDQWKFKHPMPEDIKEVFTKTSGKNLDWLFDDLMMTAKKIDYKISNVQCVDGKCAVTVKNKGDVNSPVSLTSVSNGIAGETKWYDGFAGTKSLEFNFSNCDAIRIDGETKIPEVNRLNNASRISGILKTWKPLKVHWLAAVENPKYRQIFFTPAFGWNEYNRQMAGIAFHNFFIPEKKFEYILMPLYSFGSKDLAGGGRVSYSVYPQSNFFSKINLSVSGQTYSYGRYQNDSFERLLNYRKVSSSLTFSIINRKENVDDFNDITLRNVWTETEEVKFSVQSDGNYKREFKPVSRMFNFLYYDLGNLKTFNPYSFRLTLGASNQFVLSSIEYKQTISYSQKGKGLDIRVYGGFTGSIEDEKNPVSNPVNYKLQMSGDSPTKNSPYQQDYLYDEVYLGRTESEGTTSQQFGVAQGGFKVNTPTGQSESWLVALNLKTIFPGKLPFKFFADIGAYDPQKSGENDKPINPMFDYGVEVTVIPRIFSVYLPIGYSKDIKDYYDFSSYYSKYIHRIRFELNLSKLNPFELRKQLNYLL